MTNEIRRKLLQGTSAAAVASEHSLTVELPSDFTSNAKSVTGNFPWSRVPAYIAAQVVGAIIGVRTSGILMVVNLMPTSASSDEAQRVHASSAAFEAT